MRSRTNLWLFPVATVALLLGGQEAHAEDPGITDSSEDDPFGGELGKLDLLSLIDLTVVSASKEEESVDDAPSPVTVITARMIEQSGAKTLKELLTLYVPGMTLVQDHNESNVSMRGIYGSSQQKILILQDGHRLNSRAYSAAPPDFAISLEKIKQIEVLRGPGSSLYGNIALTGVINLVTKRGEELNGGSVTAMLGSFGERKVSAIYGMGLKGRDLFVWASIYKSDGERVAIPDSEDYSVNKTGNAEAIVGGYNDTPAYDVGMRLVSGKLTIFASSRAAKYTEPFTAGGSPTGQSYDYDAFRKKLGLGPGLRLDFQHFGVTYAEKLNKNLSFSINPYADHSSTAVHLVIDPSTNKSAAPSWVEYGLGLTAQGKLKYAMAGKGSLTVGAQVDHMNLYDSEFPIQVGGIDEMGNPTPPDWSGWGDSRDQQLLAPGKETTYAGFAQVRHRVNKEILVNVGGRYDVKDRAVGANVSAISPRLAVVYSPMKQFSVKASFARSFVDAPYWYRHNSLGSYRGGADLKPEHLTSYQFTPTVKLLDGHLRYSMNIFYNELTDFIWRNNEATAEQPIYQNAGFLKSYGVENEVTYVHEKYELRSNLTYQVARDADNYGVTDDEIFNIPRLTGALVADTTPLPGFASNVHANASLRYIGSQLSPISGVVNDPGNRLKQVLLVDVGLTTRDLGWDGWKLSANIYNLTNKKWKQGGSVQHPYPQNGRWISFSATHKL